MKKLIITGAIIIIGLIVIAIFAPAIARCDPSAINIKDAYMPPSSAHIMGTDELGRDLFSRMVFAVRIALLVGIVAVGIASIIGVILGSIAGYAGGAIDNLIMRFTDVMLCFPVLFLILAVVAVIGPGIMNIMVVIGFTSWMGVARLIRAEILSLKTREYVMAARALGRRDVYIVAKHLIPNSLGPVIINFIFGISGAILTESALSFLGLGVQPPVPSWGNILMQGKDALGVAWWIMFFPGIAILVTVLAFNMLGEGLKDLLQPRIRYAASRDK